MGLFISFFCWAYSSHASESHDHETESHDHETESHDHESKSHDHEKIHISCLTECSDKLFNIGEIVSRRLFASSTVKSLVAFLTMDLAN